MPIDLTTTVQALPYVQNVAHAELVQPEAQLLASQALAQQTLAEQHKQPQRIEQQDAMDSVRDEEKKGRPDPRRSKRKARLAQAEAEETQTSNSTPFAGHIINLKI